MKASGRKQEAVNESLLPQKKAGPKRSHAPYGSTVDVLSFLICRLKGLDFVAGVLDSEANLGGKMNMLEMGKVLFSPDIPEPHHLRSLLRLPVPW